LDVQFIASGSAFDVDGFLAATGLHCDSIFRRGDQYKRTGFRRVLGKAGELSFEQQIEAASRFLDENQDVLSRLREWAGLRHVEILFSPEIVPRVDMPSTRSYTMPAAFVQTCAALGLELGVAVRLKFPDGPAGTEVHSRVDSRTGVQMKITLHPGFRDAIAELSYREVGLQFVGGRSYATMCCCGSASDKYEVAYPGKVLVNDLTAATILSAVDDILHRGALTQAFNDQPDESAPPPDGGS
jgi:hypothetical protein